MAPDRSVGSPDRQDEAHRLPRNHEEGHPGGYRAAPHGEYGSGQCPAGSPRVGPSGGIKVIFLGWGKMGQAGPFDNMIREGLSGEMTLKIRPEGWGRSQASGEGELEGQAEY